MNMMKLYCQDKGLRWLTGGFAPISLEELNSKAEMMSRIDNKYVVDRWALERILPALLEEFDILEIDDRRAFTYDTRYFDDPDCSAYYEHHQGLRKGFKVRVRRYSDAGLCFLEVKVKGKRGMTVKNRQSYDPADLGELTPEAFDYAKGVYTGHYDKAFDYDLRPALDIEYQRITLVAKEGGERMTIDGKLSFRNEKKRLEAPNDVFIVETKSALGRGYADKALRAVHARPTKKCSKYCIGMAALGAVSRWNRFMPTMRMLRLVKGTKLALEPHVLSSAA